MRKLLAAATLVAAILLLAAAPASAHAVLQASTPGDQAHLDEPPTSVRLEFNEDVSADLGGLRVYESSGDRVDEGAVRNDGPVVEVDLKDDIGDGAYIATYRVVSADGHPVQGGIVFSVGDATADPALLAQFFDEGADRPWQVAGAFFRWLAYGGTLLAAGGAVYLALVDPDDDRGRKIVRGAALVGAIGILAALPIQAALATGEGIGAIVQHGVLGKVLEDGVGLQVGLGLLGLALIVFVRARPAALVGAALACGSFAVSGHSRTSPDEGVAVAATAVHATAAGVWFGGLVLLAFALRRRRDDGEPVASAGLVARFSGLAGWAVLAVAAAGLVLAWSEVRALRALTSTTYGWTLLVKVGAAALVGLIALYNRFRLVPAIQKAKAPRAWSQLRSTVRSEAIGLVAVLAVTAALVNITPARTAAGIGEIFSGTIEFGGSDGSVNVVVDPNQAGPNAIHLYFYDENGQSADYDDPADVTVDLTLPASDIGPIHRQPIVAAPGHFTLQTDDLVTGGRWTIGVDLRISRFDEASGELEVLVGG